MENYLVYSKSVLDDLSKKFENLSFKYFIQDIGVKISVFVVHGSYSNLENGNNWRTISEEIALKFQSKITSKDDKWNLYIIYACSEKVDKDLKAKIENDKFSSRKIVDDNINQELNEELVNNLIKRHITHSDLIDIVDNTETKLEEVYVPNDPNIWSIIPNNKLVSGNLELQKNMIKQLKACCNEN
jgi:hypothetical protein